MPESLPSNLPPADWTRRADIATLFAAIDPDGTEARYVGGAVRDTLLGLPVSDIDVATRLHPDEVIARLSAAAIRSVPTGIAHGTVTALLSGGPVEITTLRRDVSTDGRRATVEFAQEWQEDAARRDFTINALSADPRTLEVFDYHGGLADLAARRLRFIGSAEQRIREDYLRILRYFRFQARFGSLPADPPAEAACSELAPGMKGLSRERVGWELTGLLALPDPAATVQRMADLGVLREVLPEASPGALPALIAAEQAAAIAPDPLRRLAALLPRDKAVAEQVAARLRLSSAQRKHLSAIAESTPLGSDERALAYRAGTRVAADRLLLAGRSPAAIAGWTAPRLPLGGGDIVARGVSAGPQVAALLRRVEDRWIKEDFPGRERACALLDEELARASEGSG